MTTDDDIDRAKKQRELEKLEIDIQNAKAITGLERFKAWAALLGPIMTAATVIGTVYLGYLQITARSNSDEDANWRQIISSIDDSSEDPLGTRNVGTLLKPFLTSARYRTLAIGVTIAELPKVRDEGTFVDLFKAAFPRPDPKDLTTLLSLARSLTAKSNRLYGTNQDERNAVIREGSVLCDPVATIVRNNSYSVLSKYLSTPTQLLPFNSIFFERCDFSEVDFSNIDLTDSDFDYVKLDGALFNNKPDGILFNNNEENINASLWTGTIWWRAKFINADLLKELLTHFKPHMFPDNIPHYYRDNTTITRADWEQNIQRLCKSANLTCTSEQIRAEFPNGP